ncbi:MAG: host attachment family protein [Burkholderiales bacterium]|nr:host attachment family protein [Burkholderiales bacterium]
MTAARISHGTWILVSDGRKALFIHQDGDHDLPNFSIQQVLEDDENPRTSEQGSDSPGTSHSSVGHGRSSVAQTDWHDLAEKAFARKTVDTLARLAKDIAVDRLVIVAPPRTLAVLRASMPPELQKAVLAEIAKDYVKHPVPEIERLLTREG